MVGLHVYVKSYKMSRLVVKNLPNKITEEIVRERFSQKGRVTDVQLKYTKDGKFRNFGFVGYKSASDAEEALKFFHNTFINTSKIKVELCADLGDSQKPRAWSKYAPDSQAYQKIHAPVIPEVVIETPTEIEAAPKTVESKKKKIDPVIENLIKEHKNDPLFMEFMKSHSRGENNTWDNDVFISLFEEDNQPEAEASTADCPPIAKEDLDHESDDSDDLEEENKVAKEKISDLEYLKKKTVKLDSEEIVQKISEATQPTDSKPARIKMPKQPKPLMEFFDVKLSGLSLKDKKKDLKQFFHPLKLRSVRIPQQIKGIAFVGFKTEQERNQALLKNRSFLGGKRISVSIYTKKVTDITKLENKDLPKWNSQEESLKNEETIAESGRIFVRNLSYDTTEEDLEQLFNKFGTTTEVSMPIDRLSRIPKGFAQVTFMFSENAVEAYTKLDGTVFNGRMLHLLPGKAKMSLEEAMEKDGLTFDAKKQLKLKAQSGSSHNWNSLFLGQNAIADVMASTYNTTKDQVLDARGNESIAVRLALGETQIVTQTKDFLINNGVKLDAFNQAPKQRSKTIVLVKNLPAKTTDKEIVELFQPHGELRRVILPPSGVTAIIEFLEPSEARTAFTRLAYTKFKNLPLYLEWAPFDTFSVAPSAQETPTAETEKSKTSGNKVVKPETEAKTQPQAEDVNEPPEDDSTLYIKNLNFNSNENSVTEHFKNCGTIHSVTIARKKDVKNPSQLLSMGYGFIRFKRKSSAENALKTLQSAILDGYALELKRSNRTAASEVESARKKTVIGEQTGSKILVRNIPFQATHTEIRDLFKTFGELKAVRLPKKMAGTGLHRGFVFVEYESKSDAKRAFEAMSQSTHFYGRRLVLEWAAKDDDVDDLRKRTADQFFSGPSNIKVLRKSTLEMDESEMADYQE